MNKTSLLVLAQLLLCLQSKAQFTLSVTNGYGSGTYAAGDTIDIWSKEFPATDVFDRWTGDVSFLEYADE